MPWLCQCVLLVFLGAPSLDRLIEILEQEDDSPLSKLKRRLIDRTQIISVVSSLVVGVTVAFLSTPPPTDFAAWNHEIPYFCIACSSGSAMLAVTSGLGQAMYLNAVRPESARWLRKSKMKLAVVATLLMVPITFLCVSTFFTLFAWLGAVWLGSRTWMKLLMTIGCLAFPLTLLVIFAALY
ncbi:hypothetical protein EDD16DRAFT_1063155 [Pisolithus croceorrhizus]|nr:hypothetical protein EDD16DRAFT_1063155 [Pisolithus croceorrhizus]